MENLVLISEEELRLRCGRLQSLMEAVGMNGMLISDNANMLALCGRIFAGYIWIPATGLPVWFVRRPVELGGMNVVYIHKPEQIPAHLGEEVSRGGFTVGLELDVTAYSHVERLKSLFPEASVANASAVLRMWRAVKTPGQIEMMRKSGMKHAQIYRKVGGLYSPGMTDHELQVELERLSRLQGCLGVFRISGSSMELFMGNVIAGDNADNPTPYDFAMGGAGLDPALPVGADGEEIREHTTVMIDLNGNFTGYMTDMTRVYALGSVSQLALDAHRCSIDICRRFVDMARPGVAAKELYAMAEDLVKERGLGRYFMGHRQHAGFVGHGIGIEVNEAPVIAPRSRDILAEGNTVALEPKFVIPHVGAVGIENTYLIKSDGVECLTPCDEEIVPLV
ncbi:MAG: aminopeptidase P family protein [Bacteroidales bacterium]|nr:aminopeptidase P family protein [Bacteroidales bacterium]